MTREETEKFILDNIDGFEISIRLKWPDNGTIRHMRYTNQKDRQNSLKVEVTDVVKDDLPNRTTNHYVNIDHMIDDLLGPRRTKASQYLGRLLIAHKLDMI